VPQEHAPAFLDGFDRVTVYLEKPVALGQLPGFAKLTVGTRAVSIKSAEGREAIAPKRDKNFVNLPGTIQRAAGGSEWDPAGESTQMTPTGPDTYELVVSLPVGRFEYKLARGGSWDENWGQGFTPGGQNMVLNVPKAGLVKFIVDFKAKTLRNSIEDKTIPTPKAYIKPAAAKTEFTSYSLILNEPVKPNEISETIQLSVSGKPFDVYPRDILKDSSFTYKGDDLGSRWYPDHTTFKVWAPTSLKAVVKLESKEVAMTKGANGVWEASIPGDLHNTRYQFKYIRYGAEHIAADINCYAATPDSKWSVVLDSKRSNPANWKPAFLFQGKPQTDAILYEAHVRDLTIDPSSGVPENLRGKYLGLATDAKPLNYIKNLGITHLHLLPFQNFNPGNSKNYNWGYETTLFNVPEEQYSTHPDDPVATVRECKQMVQALHDKGIAVVMDVVYNHSVPSIGPQSAFWETVPYAMFRTNDRGDVMNESGVGNALNDDQPMVRKYICDSLAYWAKEYAIDGFRFDLIGMFTPQSVSAFAAAIRQVNPSAVIYGEPWTGGGPLRFAKGAQKGMGVGVFNDNFRNAFRGQMDTLDPDFLTGSDGDLNGIKNGVLGSVTDFADQPSETINYISAHDNMTLFDRVKGNPASLKLAYAATLLSEGVPFLEGGPETGRTKKGSNNSYNGGDELNRYDWALAPKHTDDQAYLRGLIQIRKAYPQLRLPSKAEIQEKVTFLKTDGATNTVAYQIAGSKKLMVILHGSTKSEWFQLPAGAWSILANETLAQTTPLGTAQGSVMLNGLGATVLVQG